MDGIPPAALPFAVRSPGKCILFGEHAVVYGKPELLLAIDLETHASFTAAERTELNHDPEAATHHPYFHAALARWPPASPVGVGVISRVPKAAGLGSSAAFTAAITAGLSALQGGVERGELAQRAFDAERTAQGIGSPGDTTASVAGGYVAVNGGGHELLWSVAAGDQRWTARRVSDPRWVWVLGYTGVPRDTATTVRAVAE
ncbi:MAG TPA: hypothetical protein VJS68_03465, partial [Thermoplasmata archaeon]|nr:hypothetical protein [Thermoplasmata archaeon]